MYADGLNITQQEIDIRYSSAIKTEFFSPSRKLIVNYC